MKRAWQIFWHIFFWVSTIALCVIITRANAKVTVSELVVIFGVYGSINISLFYLNLLVLLPRFLDTKQYSLFAISVTAALIAYGVLKYSIAVIFRQYILIHSGHTMGFGIYFLNAVFTNLLILFLSTLLKFSIDWFMNERIQRNLENQRLSAELAFLKSQINPHFLFNSLNSIYSLAYQRSETTPDAILKLSEIMRYMLYECNDNRVELSKEIQYLQNYIDLQKIRFGDKAAISFKVTGDIENQQIVPLILIAFIENAFKHGVVGDAMNPISITIDVHGPHLQFYIRNKKHTNNKDLSGGIGLSNVRRRLNLLYSGQYILHIDDELQTYTCDLSLNL